MARTPEEIEVLFRVGEGGDDDVIVSEDEKAWRTIKMKEVLLASQQAWVSGSETLDLIAEKIGDGSRAARWRVAIGDSGLLGFFLGILAVDGLRQPLRIHILRLIGNSCADTDENRAKVVESGRLQSIIALLEDDSILAFVIPVIYNICVDYEPAQLQACNARLSSALVDIVSSPRLLQCQAFLNIICKILALLATQDPELKLANPATPSLLLSLATSRTYTPDLEDFCGLTSVALAYLTHEQFQVQLVNSSCFELLQQAFYSSFILFDVANSDPDDAAQLRRAWVAFVQVFADISALPTFSAAYPLSSPAIERLVAWLHGPASSTHLQVAACLSLGNLCRSDEASTTLIKDAYIPLFNILANAVSPVSSPASPSAPALSPSTQLLHAALSFLKNLAIPVANKPLIGSLLDQPLSVLPNIWSTTDAQPDAQFAAVSLTRLLLVQCPANVRRICTPLSDDPSSPAYERSGVHKLIGLVKHSEAEPTKLEAARAVATVCRALQSQPILDLLSDRWEMRTETDVDVGGSSSDNNGAPPSSDPASKSTEADDAAGPATEGLARRACFYKLHMELNVPLQLLLEQRRFPVLRSEVLFVLALMSRSEDGERVAVRVFQHDFETCRALIEVVTGRDMFDGRELLEPTEQGGENGNGNGALDLELSTGLAAAGQEQSEEVRRTVEDLGLVPQQVDPGQASRMKNVDRENGLVLLSEVMKKSSHLLPPPRRHIFQEILSRGGELVLHAREESVGNPVAPEA